MKTNDAFQMFNIRRSLARAGVDPEKYDVSANLDRTLSYSENMRNIKTLTQGGSRRTLTDGRPRKRSPRGGEFRQRGKTNEALDRKRAAKIPGKRHTRKGTVYYERRRNRSDRPGWFT